MYTGDFDSWYPPSYPALLECWHTVLTKNNYIPKPVSKKPTILCCPRSWNKNFYYSDAGTYGMNVQGRTSGIYPTWRIIGSRVVTDNANAQTFWQNTVPGNFILIADSVESLSLRPDEQNCWIGYSYNWDISLRHGNARANVLFGDAHVDNSSKNDLIEIGWPAGQIYP
jgi:prepilin-type processing-associated H-X9-DG protein